MADNNDKQPKRRLRNAESIRERALKAQQEAAKPTRRAGVTSRLRRVVAAPFRFIGKPLTSFGRLLALVFNRQPFRFIAKLLRPIGKIFFLGYFTGSWRELRLVTWPNRKQSRQLTFAVLVFAVMFGAVVAALDYGLDKLFKQVLVK